jgi:hypothetical protein
LKKEGHIEIYQDKHKHLFLFFFPVLPLFDVEGNERTTGKKSA